MFRVSSISGGLPLLLLSVLPPLIPRASWPQTTTINKTMNFGSQQHFENDFIPPDIDLVNLKLTYYQHNVEQVGLLNSIKGLI